MSEHPSSTAGVAAIEQLASGVWLGGESASSEHRIDVVDPATDAVVGSAALVGPDHVRRAADLAAAAQPSWAATPPRQRAEILRRAHELLVARADTFAAIITAEMGKPLHEARGETMSAADYFRWASEDAARIAGHLLDSPAGGAEVQVRRRAVGPCYLITPWNFPLSMGARKIAPALAAGCTAMVKPSELTPFSMLALAELLAEAGVPEGVLSVLVADRPEVVTEVLVADPRIRKLSFTGSTRVGRLLLVQAATNVMRTSMELGGNAPVIVAEGVDLDEVVAHVATAKLRNAGQTCVTPNRFYVHASVADDFVAAVAERFAGVSLGHGATAGTDCGPMINRTQRDRVASMVAAAIDDGAALVSGGVTPEGPGSFHAPTVLADVSPDSRIVREEIFGPVLAVQRFSDLDAAIAEANAVDVGLAGYVFDRDLERGLAIAERLEVGMVGLNTGVVSDVATPFGGVKASGLGREGGLSGIDEYLEERAVRIPRRNENVMSKWR
ncbi:MAG: NAD-dependent succinate-semialdehyde dehydrogenase [Actinobacteria bacterium]|nr:NAD-dependent succinate-semialdehyde dehydrogenase [Actinomycetota bacterium]